MLTLTRNKRKARNKRIYAYYCKLMLTPDAMVTACTAEVSRKFGMSYSQTKAIIRRESATSVQPLC